MSGIAAAVGGSKTTLWSRFDSKEELFAAVVDEIVERYGAALTFELDRSAPVAVVLRGFARAMMATVLSPEVVALHRLVIGEVQRFPELGVMLFERGPGPAKARLAAYLSDAMDDGRLRSGDAVAAARHLTAMCQAGRFQEALLGMASGEIGPDVEAEIEIAIDSFIRAWTIPRSR